MNVIRLREVLPEDFAVFHRNECDEVARQVAAFANAPPDEQAFAARWAERLADNANFNRTILVDDQAVGCLASFVAPWSNQRELCYWISRDHWGRGVATDALKLFLPLIAERPLHARAAVDNLGSIRVLEKCGFVRIGTASDFAPARGGVVEEVVFRLP